MVSERDSVHDVMECPECGIWDAKHQWTDSHSNEINEKRTFGDYPADYTMLYGNSVYQGVNVYDG